MKHRFTMIELFMLMGVFTLLATVIAYSLPKAEKKQTKVRQNGVYCKMNLKNIGTQVYYYFEDNNLSFPQPLPFKELTPVTAGGTLDISVELIRCPYTRSNFVWLYDKEFTASADKQLASDGQNHEGTPLRFTVFQDGHVE